MPERRRATEIRRGRRAVLLSVALLAAAALLLGTRMLVLRGASAIAGTELFRVAALELEGGTYLTLAEAAEAAAIPPEASVWDDPATWEAALAGHPLVRSARIRRRLPGTLVLVVDEREPVALAPAPALEPVDAEGQRLPIDPAAHGLDLPLLDVDPLDGDTARMALLAAEAARLAVVDPVFLARTSELTVDERGDVVARWGDPPATFRFRPAVPARRLREATFVLSHWQGRSGGRVPPTVDLRFADQVVVRVP